MMYILSTGCKWHAIPKGFPARSTLFAYFDLWDYDGTLERTHHSLYIKCREAMGRGQPDGRRYRKSERERRRKREACTDPSGFDAGKKIKGKKRHILVDATCLLLHAIVHPANIQDRDGGILVLQTLFGKFPFLKKLFADGGYQGPVFRQAQKKALPSLETEIVKRSDTAVGFEIIPRWRIVERTIA